MYMCVLRVRNVYTSTAAFDGKSAPAVLELASSCFRYVREDGLNAGMGYRLVLRVQMELFLGNNCRRASNDHQRSAHDYSCSKRKKVYGTCDVSYP
jgi:hypothetical protein